MRAPLCGVCALLVLLVAAGAADAQLRLRPYLTGLSAPLAIVTDPTNASVQFVVEQAGVIRVVQNGALTGTFLDLTSVVLSGGERGLFSIAFRRMRPPAAASS